MKSKTKMSEEAEHQWINDGHTIIWDDDGPMLIHPDSCPFVIKTGKVSDLEFRIYECIPGIEEIENGFEDDATYKGGFYQLPWDDPYMIEGEIGIEWYYEAYWVDGLENGDEYYDEFGWRELSRKDKKEPPRWDDKKGWI